MLKLGTRKKQFVLWKNNLSSFYILRRKIK
nr:MAG TPA: hypothetical protein [Caudoviricetes sp.]